MYFCKRCNKHFESTPVTVSHYVLCPDCCMVVEALSEYGYGPCYPTGFYLGNRKVAELYQSGKIPGNHFMLWRDGESEIELEENSFPIQVNQAYQIVYKWLNGEK